MEEIKAYSLNRLQNQFSEWGIPLYRAKQVYQWLYQKGARSYDEMTSLPYVLREQLNRDLPYFPAKVRERRLSKDGSRKYLLEFHDQTTTETVVIPSKNRVTVCFSTQVGCAMSCGFCATGKEGFTRNLLPGEMAEQIYFVQQDMGKRVDNLVAMGQGEPFLNYNNVLDALRIFNGENGFTIAARHITVSTCGIIEGIKRFAHEKEQFRLAVSLHSALQKTRDEIMPKVARQPLRLLRDALLTYQKETNRRVTFEYILLAGINDTKEHLKALIDYCQNLNCYVNLIRLNKTDESLFEPSSPKKTDEFMRTLMRSGVEVTLRKSRGSDIGGACGQLKNKRG